jgi:tRNA(Arg) A34 adenosine deaminase TadA
MTDPHETFLRRCILLSQQAAARGDHPFGALLVHNGQIVMEAENTINSEQDITLHAELSLVSQASRALPPEVLQECTLYTSTEPCAMCAGAIYWAGIPRVVFACSATRLGQITGGSLVIPCREVFKHGQHQVMVEGPILEEEAVAIHNLFW